jgi:hypothetical protein
MPTGKIVTLEVESSDTIDNSRTKDNAKATTFLLINSV